MGRKLPFKGILKLAKGKLKEIKIEDLKAYCKYFNEASFSDKLRQVGSLLGRNILIPVLKAYYVLQSPTTKASEKAMLVGALGYFILPVDFIPDFLAGLIGFSDDLMVISFVLGKVHSNLTPEIEEKAEAAYRKIVGSRIAAL